MARGGNLTLWNFVFGRGRFRGNFSLTLMPASRPTSLNVLFIGNSFTARNDLPRLIAKLAQSRGLSLEHRLISMGGASLRMHWNREIAPAVIRDGKFDYVVLQ